MRTSPLLLGSLDRYREYGAVWIRLLVGYRLVYGTVDNVTSAERMTEFALFLDANGFPWPQLSAHVSAWAQFACGLLFLVGALTRPAAAVMVVNFAVALLVVHSGTPYLEDFDALAMLFGSIFLLLHGAGALSVDDALRRRAERRLTPGRGPGAGPQGPPPPRPAPARAGDPG